MAPDRSPKRSRKHSESSKKKESSSFTTKHQESSFVIRTRQPDPSVDPILCSFPAGMPAALQKESSVEEATLPRFVIKKHQKESKLVVGKDHACLYSAVATPSAAARRPMQLVVGIYDKHKKELILQPTAEQGFVYAMSQTVPSYNRESDAAEKMMSPADRRKALFEDFGSAKKRKVLRSQEANRVNVESVVGAGDVNSILNSMSESNRQAVDEQRDGTTEDRVSAADLATQEWRKNFLPAYNEQAESPAGVYSAKTIAGSVVWNRLLHRVSKCLAQDNVLEAIVKGPKRDDEEEKVEEEAATQQRPQDEWYPSVVRILKLLVPQGDVAKQQLACAILLNHYLRLYIQLHRRRFFGGIEGSDRPLYFGVPLDVGRRWVECFTTSTEGRDGQMGHVMSKANKDSCCVHLYLLSLMAEGGRRVCSDNIQPLAEDLQMDVKDASHLLRLAGCNVTRKSSKQTTAALTTPLKFPSMKRAGKRK
eukprot:scaffold6120_cov162-Amphora_coffeaeformis.AAC.2